MWLQYRLPHVLSQLSQLSLLASSPHMVPGFLRQLWGRGGAGGAAAGAQPAPPGCAWCAAPTISPAPNPGAASPGEGVRNPGVPGAPARGVGLRCTPPWGCLPHQGSTGGDHKLPCALRPPWKAGRGAPGIPAPWAWEITGEGSGVGRCRGRQGTRAPLPRGAQAVLEARVPVALDVRSGPGPTRHTPEAHHEFAAEKPT